MALKYHITSKQLRVGYVDLFEFLRDPEKVNICVKAPRPYRNAAHISTVTLYVPSCNPVSYKHRLCRDAQTLIHIMFTTTVIVVTTVYVLVLHKCHSGPCILT
jgi:hypothetical protein